MCYIEHQFRCIRCANKGIPLMRNKGFQHGKFHRKKLYCVHCKTDVNHIEIKSEEELEEFLKNWEDGVYHEEAENSLAYCGCAGIR